MAFVQVPPDSTGNKVETTTDGTTMRQVINIGKNAASGADIAPVDATLGLAVNTLELAAQKLDYDTGAGTATQVVMGIALPASGGPVAGGTATAPLRVSPIGTPSFTFDYMTLTQASTTDTWVRKSGGSGGSTVQTITITYTDSTKTVIATVGWT